MSQGALAGLLVSEVESGQREWVGGLPVSATTITSNWWNYGVMRIVRAGMYPLDGGGKVGFTVQTLGLEAPVLYIVLASTNV